MGKGSAGHFGFLTVTQSYTKFPVSYKTRKCMIAFSWSLELAETISSRVRGEAEGLGNHSTHHILRIIAYPTGS